MKKIIIMSFLFILFFAFNGKIFACESPYNEHVIKVTYTNNCDYWIYYCCWWDNANHKLHVIFEEVTTYPNCKISMEDWPAFRDWMATQMMNDAISKCAPQLPSCDPPPPYTINVVIASCLYYKNWWFYVSAGEAEWMLSLVACNQTPGICERRLSVCIDYSQNPPQITTLVDDCVVIQEPECSTTEPQIPPQGKTWFEPWTTTCFAIPCCE
ncbi:MAG: hypothetical protein HW421_4034 [Ignavibacteria bacterium]|nr:hypothetical protein [Ignavibacteria bacterium]